MRSKGKIASQYVNGLSHPRFRARTLISVGHKRELLHPIKVVVAPYKDWTDKKGRQKRINRKRLGTKGD
jgi:hypothetical protein